MSKAQTIEIRQNKLKKVLLEQLHRTPIKELACEKSGVSRMTLHRWMKASQKFARQVETALSDGREFINDLAESQVISLIRQGEIKAVRLWLQHNSPRYANKIELSGTVNTCDEPLTTEQKALVRLAHKLSSSHDHGQKIPKGKTPPRKDASGQEVAA